MPEGKEPFSENRKSSKVSNFSRLAKAVPHRVPRAQSKVEEFKAEPIEPIDWKRLLACCGILLLSIYLLYGLMLTGRPVFNDEINWQALTTASDDNSFWLMLLSKAFGLPLTEPWVRLTYALDVVSFPRAPAFYHLVNISLHTVSCIYFFLFVFQFVRRLRIDQRTKVDPIYAGVWAALLLACHPLASGAVAYVSGRGPILVACNYFLSLNFFLLGYYAKSVGGIVRYYLLTILFIIIGVTCGALAITTPMAIVALVLILKPVGISQRDWLRERWQDLVTFTLIAAVAFLTVLTPRPALLDNGVDLAILPTVSYLATEAKVFATYFLRCFFLPFGLSVAPPFVVAANFLDPFAILGLLLQGTGIALLFRFRQKPVLFFACLLTLLGLLPNVFLVQHEYVSDQRFYISLAGLCLAVGWLTLPAIVGPKADKNVKLWPDRKIQLLTAFSVLLLLAGLTVWRETAWLTNDRLWRGALKLNRSDARALAWQARALQLRGRGDESIKIAKEALRLDPALPTAYHNIGMVQLGKRQFSQAEENFERAYELARARQTAEDQVSIYATDLADACWRSGDWPKAKNYAIIGMMSRPTSPLLNLSIGEALVHEHQPMLALKYLQRGFEADRQNPDFLEPLADAALQIGGKKYVQFAFEMAKRAVAINGTPSADLLYIRAALDMGFWKTAFFKLEQFIPRAPHNAQAVYCMSYLMHFLKNDAAAKQWEDQALKIDPNIKNEGLIKPVQMATPPATGGGAKPAQQKTDSTSH